MRRWEDEKVGRAQSAWGIGHRAEGRRGKMRRWEKARLRDGEAEESGELGEQTVLWIGFANIHR